MYCPACSSTEIKVLDSRPYLDTNQIRRRRQCLQCEHRFSTIETIETGMPKIIKRSGSLADFDVAKIRKGVMRAVEKRPISLGQFEALIEKIINRINAMQVKHLHSEQVGYIIIEELRDVDLVAMIRFASVYHAFQDINSFRKFVEEVSQNRDKEYEK